MSGPVTTRDAITASDHAGTRAGVDVIESRIAEVGRFSVRRALPRAARRTVGPWCFADHFGPAAVTEERGLDIGPHPHIGLQTVTWLVEGEVLHRDSLGSEQTIRPGQLNLMTAGAGVAHSEEATGQYRGDLHGIQFWVAQPTGTRDGRPAFEHHADLPRVEWPGCVATVLVGDVETASSPARRDTDHVGAELRLHADTTVPLDSAFEHALIVLRGALTVDGTPLSPGRLAYLGTGRDECRLGCDEEAIAMLIGGAELDEPILMWWNFVARTEHEISDAYRDWSARSERFGVVASPLPDMDTRPPPWDRPGTPVPDP
jgi:redox-sensitive bicupin YhaK (pirin superfamily)